MATNNDNTFGSEKLALDNFTRATPPGWRPGIRRYPYKRLLQLMKLWWRQTDVDEARADITIAGRLRGAAFQFALGLCPCRSLPARSSSR